MIDLPAIGIVIASALIDSLNPGSIGVFILLIALALGQGMSVKRMAILCSTYIAAVFATYLLAGFGIIYLFSGFSTIIAEYIAIIVAILIMIAGLIEIKDYFWYGRWLSLKIPAKVADKIHNYSQKDLSIIAVILLGSFVSIIEFPSTGAPYLAVITILQVNLEFSAVLLILLYNLLFVLPLAIILLAVVSGKRLNKLAQWKEDSKATFRLFSGVLLVALSWILILIANHTINFN